VLCHLKVRRKKFRIYRCHPGVANLAKLLKKNNQSATPRVSFSVIIRRKVVRQADYPP
jgi:hypothetical protein